MGKKPGSKYVKRPYFGDIMGRTRFEALFSCVVFSIPPADAYSPTSTEKRWGVVSDFVDAFNEHRQKNVRPGSHLCVDESMIRWYDLRGAWIEVGSPHYVSLDRKPEDGYEVQNIACGDRGIILKLELVSTAADVAKRSYEGSVNHGTAVLKRLTEPWRQSNRIICADSYFASVEAALAMLNIALKVIGVVKTATRGFPMKHLSEIEMPGSGAYSTLVSKTGP